MCGGLTSGGRHLTSQETAAIRAEAMKESRHQNNVSPDSPTMNAAPGDNPTSHRGVALDLIGRVTFDADFSKDRSEGSSAATGSPFLRGAVESDKREMDIAGVSCHW